MRTGLAYTSARILLLVISLVVLYLAGARGFLLLALAFLVSALASYILLSRQREVMAGALNRRLGKVTNKAAEFRERLREGAAAEDEDDADEEQTVR
jgi:Zn-dependent protease with chaperone function